jgi:probable HAF family extracellular repeat protein
MNRMIRSVYSTAAKVFVLHAFALTLLISPAIGLAAQESGGEQQKRHRKDDKDAGLRGNGFVSENGAFTTIDAPRAEAFTIVFGIDEGGRTVGGYVDSRGTLHGFLFDKRDFTVIDFPGAKATFAARINNRGQIVGAYSDDPNSPALELTHGFLLDNGVFTTIDVPGAVRTQPFGINNHGQIVGEYVDTAGKSHGFLLDNGAFLTIDAPAPSGVEGPGGASTIAFDIDDSGQIVGVSATLTAFRGFLRDAQGAFVTIEFPNVPVGGTVLTAINNLGQIAGYYAGADGAPHGFLRDEQDFTTVDVPDATGGTMVFDINDGGQIAGVNDIVSHGYLQERRGDFSAIDHPDAVLNTEPIGVNNHGQVVGYYVDADGRRRGFLRDKQGFTPVDVPGALESLARKVNDHGQIVGGYVDANGTVHGFLLNDGIFTTIDIPGALQSDAFDIDNRGQIAGLYQDAAGMLHGFLRDEGGDFTTIDVPGATATQISGINDRGQMVGVYSDADGTLHGFLLDNDVITVIDVPNAAATQPNDVNNRGQIVGIYRVDVRRHGFLLSNGVFSQITVPGAFLESAALGLDDRGRIVGRYF